MVFVSKIIVAALLYLDVSAQNVPVIVSPLTGGVDQATGQRPLRLDIAQMNGPALDLYLLAMQEFMAVSQQEKLSWFQFAGL